MKNLLFSSGCCYTSARLCSLTNLLVYAIKDYLVEYSYNALLAGIQSYMTNLLVYAIKDYLVYSYNTLLAGI